MLNVEEGNGAYRDLVGEHKVKKHLVRRRCGWKDNIKSDIQEIRRGSWTELTVLGTGTSRILLCML